MHCFQLTLYSSRMSCSMMLRNMDLLYLSLIYYTTKTTWGSPPISCNLMTALAKMHLSIQYVWIDWWKRDCLPLVFIGSLMKSIASPCMSISSLLLQSLSQPWKRFWNRGGLPIEYTSKRFSITSFFYFHPHLLDPTVGLRIFCFPLSFSWFLVIFPLTIFVCKITNNWLCCCKSLDSNWETPIVNLKRLVYCKKMSITIFYASVNRSHINHHYQVKVSPALPFESGKITSSILINIEMQDEITTLELGQWGGRIHTSQLPGPQTMRKRVRPN